VSRPVGPLLLGFGPHIHVLLVAHEAMVEEPEPVSGVATLGGWGRPQWTCPTGGEGFGTAGPQSCRPHQSYVMNVPCERQASRTCTVRTQR
jgi:hypothetical protein